MGNALTCGDVAFDELLSCRPKLERVVASNPKAREVHTKLVTLLQDRPYISRQSHPLNRWVEKCQEYLEAEKIAEAEDSILRLQTAITVDGKRLKATFSKFDIDNSGELDVPEFRHFMTYVGFGPEALEALLKESDRDADGKISFEEFETFVGQAGGIMALFEARRKSNCTSEESGLAVGSRVRSYIMQDGKQSQVPWDARVLEVNSESEPTRVKLEIGTGTSKWEEEVPIDWIEEDVDLVDALSKIGILGDSQHYWTILLPPSEQQVVKSLTPCQQKAMFEVRRQAAFNHNEVLQDLKARCAEIGISDVELWSTLTWVRDMAPIHIHVNLDTVGEFLEKDTHYRNQFETKSSEGLLDENVRDEWEHDLFAGSYDGATPFERPKYGVMDVMNDHRGIVGARQYGDSYLTLKDVRLRCTFAPEDSGGIVGSRLAVLDQYAHVLLEYSDDELREVARVANAPEGSEDHIGDSTKLQDYCYKEAQIHGEIDLKKHVRRLVAHPKHKVDGWTEDRIRNLCKLHGWEFAWMHHERQRRISEAPVVRDSKVMKLSWDSAT